MLKPIFTALVLAAAIALPVQAQSAKIATIRSGDVAAQAPQFKAMQDKLKAEFERRQNEIEAEMKRFQEDGANFKKEADMLAAGDRAKKEKDLATRRIDLEAKGRGLQEEFGRRREQLLIETMGKLKTVIEQVAKEKGVAVVVENPVYAAPEYDITADVVKRLQTTK
ncbi:MAG TPA: OmpH family outer membrane protein [Solimonas sp.]|nr:OmpH family outer membrane protein [Solimonas sp.]